MFECFFPSKKYQKPPYLEKIDEFGKLQIVRLKGDMDQSMIPIVEKRIQDNRKNGDTIDHNILLDFKNVGRVDSSAIAFHLIHLKEYQAKTFMIAFINLSKEHLSLLEIFRQDHLFKIYQSEELAVQELNGLNY